MYGAQAGVTAGSDLRGRKTASRHAGYICNSMYIYIYIYTCTCIYIYIYICINLPPPPPLHFVHGRNTPNLPTKNSLAQDFLEIPSGHENSTP